MYKVEPMLLAGAYRGHYMCRLMDETENDGMPPALFDAIEDSVPPEARKTSTDYVYCIRRDIVKRGYGEAVKRTDEFFLAGHINKCRLECYEFTVGRHPEEKYEGKAL